MRDPITLDGGSLTVDQVVDVAREFAPVEIRPGAIETARRSRQRLEDSLTSGAAIYGVNTGFGKLADVAIDDSQLVDLQRNLIRSHVAGIGDPLPSDVVRGLMLLRANVLLRETSGVRPIIAETLVQMLNEGITPIVPEQGSVGASGDLAPLSHVALAVMGEGDVVVLKGGRATGSAASTALSDAGIEPVEFGPKEGLSFINGTQAQSSILAMLVYDARRLWLNALGAAAASLEALRGTPVAYDERIHASRPHEGQVEAARILRDLLEDSEIRRSHLENDPRVQDAYSLRCAPQVMGAVYDAIEYAAKVVDVELNSSTDNPLLFDREVVSGGNFHGQPVAQALDVLAIGLTTLAGISERRIERIVNPDLSGGLPAFLTPNAGVQSGFMMIQISAASLVAESRSLCSPGSVQSIPTDANQEDFVPMGMASAFKARRIAANARRVVAAELLTATQGLEFLQPLSPGVGVQSIYDRVRKIVPELTDDRPLGPDVEMIHELLFEETLV